MVKLMAKCEMAFGEIDNLHFALESAKNNGF